MATYRQEEDMADIRIVRSRSKVCFVPITHQGEVWLRKTFILPETPAHIVEREHEEDVIQMIKDAELDYTEE